jgi:hypothetical protein
VNWVLVCFDVYVDFLKHDNCDVSLSLFDGEMENLFCL